ncbi:MAG: hypothetical protein NTX49_10385 [Chlamydiae bacterium]|nr:hypothetical protein [Chlamydiota bacterium]
MSGIASCAVSGSRAPYSPMVSGTFHHRTRSGDGKYQPVSDTSSAGRVAPLHIFIDALVAGATSGHPPLHPSTPPSAARPKKVDELSPLSLTPTAARAMSSAATRAILDLGSGLHRRVSVDSTMSCQSEELSRAISGHFDSFPMGSITAAAVTNIGFLIVSSRTSNTLDIDDLSLRVDISVGYPTFSIEIPLNPSRLLVGPEQTIFASYSDGTILGFNPKGIDPFRTKIKGLSSMMCADQLLFAGSSKSSVEVFALDPSLEWQHQDSVDLTSSLGSPPISLSYGNGKLFCGSGKGNIVCVDLKLKTQTLLELAGSLTVHKEGVTHLLQAEGLLVSVAGNEINFWDDKIGRLKHKVTSNSIFRAITYSNGKFYLATTSNQIMVISKKDVDKGTTRLEAMDLPNRDTSETLPEESYPLSEEALRPQPCSRKLLEEYAASDKIFTVYTDPDSRKRMIQYMEPLKLPQPMVPMVVNPYAKILALNATTFIDPTTKESVNKLVIVGNNAVGLLTIN